MGTVISCTKSSEVAGLTQNVVETPQEHMVCLVYRSCVVPQEMLSLYGMLECKLCCEILLLLNVADTWEIGTAISCTKSSQVAWFIQKVGRHLSKAPLFMQLSFVQLSFV